MRNGVIRIGKKIGFNKYTINGDTTTIYISGKYGNFECLIDTEDLEKVNDYHWYIHKHDSSQNPYYARTTMYIRYNPNENKKMKLALMESIIMGTASADVVDHKNNNPLDNRKDNLRVVSKSENCSNRTGRNRNNKSGYRNVFWNTGLGKWQVSLCKNYKRICVGCFDDVEEAGRAAENARKQYYGEFAGSN